MTPEALREMRGELVKSAGLGASLSRYVRPLAMQISPVKGALGGIAGGAVLGAGGNVAREIVARGEDYSGAAIRGAAGGALLGGMGGFGIGKARDIAMVTGKKGLGLAGEMTRRTGKSVADWGKRQAHGVTGWVPKAGPESIGLRGAAQKNQRKVVEALRDYRLSKAVRGGKGIRAGAKKELEALAKRQAAAKESYGAGLTSLPGLVKGMKDPKRLGKAIRGNMGAGMGGIAGAAALPAAFTAADLASGVDPREAVGGGVGDLAGMTVAGALPIIPQLAAWSALSEGGRAIGRMVKGKKKKTPRVSPPAPSLAPVQPIGIGAAQ